MDWDDFKKCKIKFRVRLPNGQISEFDNFQDFGRRFKEYTKDHVKKTYLDPITLLEMSEFGIVIICPDERTFVKF